MISTRLHGDVKFIVAFFLAGLSLALLLMATIFIPSAVVSIKTESEPVSITINVHLDSSLSKLSPTLLAMPARLVTRDEYLKIKDSTQDNWVTDDRLTIWKDGNEKIILYQKADLSFLAKRKIAQILRQGWEIMPSKQLVIRLQEISVDADQAGALMSASVEATAVPSIPYAKWLHSGGQRPEYLRADIEAINGVGDVKIEIYPSFWPFLPMRAKQIVFSISNY